MFLQGTTRVHNSGNDNTGPFERAWHPNAGECKAWAYKLLTKKGKETFALALREAGLDLTFEPTEGDAPCDTDGAFEAACGLTVGRHNQEKREELQVPQRIVQAAQEVDVHVLCVRYQYDKGECWEIGRPLKTVGGNRQKKRPNAPEDASAAVENDQSFEWHALRATERGSTSCASCSLPNKHDTLPNER